MSIKLKILKTASRFNQAQRLMSMYESLAGETPWSSKLEIDEEMGDFQLEDRERKGYVLLPLIPAYDSLLLRFGVLGHAFRTNGYEPIILRDDGDLPARPENTIEDEGNWLKTEIYQRKAKKYSEKFGVESVSIGEVLGHKYTVPETDLGAEELQSYTRHGIDISGCVAASTKKYLMKYTLDLSDPEVRSVYESFLRSGIMLADATQKMIEKYDLMAAIVNEVSYIQGRIPLKLCHESGLLAYSQGSGHQQSELKFGRAVNRNPMGQFGNQGLTSKAVRTKLTEQQKERVNELMSKREIGEHNQYIPDSDSSVDVSEDQMVGVFSHLLWDGALEPEQAIYGDFYDWLGDTIEIGTEMENTHFVVKAHPGEALRGTNESVMDWIDENYDPLPDNFTVLPPDTEVNTYALIHDLNAGAVYASTVGLEMAFNGKPVVTGGYPPYHGFGVTHDPSSQSEYRETLRRVDELEYDDEMKKRAERFTYFFFICKHLRFPYLSEFLESDGNVLIEHGEIAREDGVYQSIVNQMLNGEEVIEPGCMGLK